MPRLGNFLELIRKGSRSSLQRDVTTSMHTCACFIGNLLRAVHACVQWPVDLLTGPGASFPVGGGALGLSTCVAASLTTHHARHMYSERSCIPANMCQHSATLANFSSSCCPLPLNHLVNASIQLLSYSRHAYTERLRGITHMQLFLHTGCSSMLPGQIAA